MSEGLPPHLAKIGPWLEAAVIETQGTHSIADVLSAIASGRLQLWVGERCFAVTEFVNFPQKRGFNVFLAGGDASEFKDIQHGMEAFARAGGATLFMHQGKMTDDARRRVSAWERIGRGFKATWIAMTKELTP